VIPAVVPESLPAVVPTGLPDDGSVVFDVTCAGPPVDGDRIALDGVGIAVDVGLGIIASDNGGGAGYDPGAGSDVAWALCDVIGQHANGELPGVTASVVDDVVTVVGASTCTGGGTTFSVVVV
jgi:hypothetical protein